MSCILSGSPSPGESRGSRSCGESQTGSGLCARAPSLQLCPTLCDPRTVACTRLLRPWNFLGKNTGVGCHFLLQGIFLTQGSNPGLPHCRQTLYHLSHQGSPMPKKGNAKECSKFSKPGFSNTRNVNFLMFKLVLEKVEKPEIKLPTSAGSWKKQESSRKTSISALLTMPKPLTVWITINYGKF